MCSLSFKPQRLQKKKKSLATKIKEKKISLLKVKKFSEASMTHSHCFITKLLEFNKSLLLKRGLLKKLIHPVNSKNKEIAGNSRVLFCFFFFTSSRIYSLAQTRLLLITPGNIGRGEKKEKQNSMLRFIFPSYTEGGGGLNYAGFSFLPRSTVSPHSLYPLPQVKKSVQFSLGKERCLLTPNTCDKRGFSDQTVAGIPSP